MNRFGDGGVFTPGSSSFIAVEAVTGVLSLLGAYWCWTHEHKTAGAVLGVMTIAGLGSTIFQLASPPVQMTPTPFIPSSTPAMDFTSLVSTF